MQKYVLGLLGGVVTLLMTGCSFQKQTSTPPPVIPVSDNTTLQEMNPSDLLTTNGSINNTIILSGTNITVQDDGMRQIFVGSTSGDQIKSIINWLTTAQQPSSSKELLVKQATIGVGGHRLIIPGGAALAPYIEGYQVTVTTQNNDLVLEGSFTTASRDSFVIFRNNLPKNYVITNPDNRFGSYVYVIPKETYSILTMQWGSDIQQVGLRYASGGIETSLAFGYEDRMLGKYIMPDDIVVPETTTLKVVGLTPSVDAHVFHLTLDDKNKEISLDEKQIPQLQAREAVTLYLQEKGFGLNDVQDVSPTSSGDRILTTNTAKEQAILVVEPTFTYLLPVHNYPFILELEKNASDEYRPYYSRFLTSSLLNEDSVRTSLDRLFGEKNYTYDSFGKGFSYEIQPGRTYSGTLEIYSLFGQVVRVPASYFTEFIHPKAVVQEIVSNQTISILPRGGNFQDVLIQHKNIASFPISFQACALNTTPDVLGTNKGGGIENYLFSCDTTPFIQELTVPASGFVYRKAYRTPITIPEDMSQTDAFRVFFTDQNGKEQSHYFLKSDIGLWTKIAGNELWIWGFGLNEGALLDNASVKVTNLEGATIGTATLRDGVAKISIPSPTQEYDYATQRKKDTFLIVAETDTEQTFVVAQRSGRGDLSVPLTETSERYLKINSKLELSEVVPSSLQIQQRGMFDPLKIYGYTDRGLYKAGDTVYFAGWVRNVLRLDTLDYLSGKMVDVTIQSPLGGESVLLEQLPLDSFGGFEGSYTLPTTLTLGEWIVEYRFSDTVAYTHNIKVEEYQKPTFFVDMSYQEDKQNKISLVLNPTYYFGTPLTIYDTQVTRSLVGKDVCRYCRRWNENEYYYNHVFQDTIATGGKFTLYNQTGSLVESLYDASFQANKGYQYTLKIEAIVKDKLSDETQFVTKYLDFQPEVMVGLAGQPYERLYRDETTPDPRSTWKLEGKIDKGSHLIDKLYYEVYVWNYDQQLQQGVDGNLYYINGQGYLPVASGTLASTATFSLAHEWLQEPGEYFVRVYAQDASGNTIGEVQKKISRYKFEKSGDLLGAVPNNYTLTVDIPKETYEEGEMIPLNIAPYQRGAWVVITVEKGQHIIDTVIKQLDGGPLTLPVKKGYAPNIIVSVMMLQATEANTTARKEPRFFAGYAEAQIDSASQELVMTVIPDRQKYFPGDQVQLTITTHDHAGNPVDARVSLSVVDEALTSLYSLLKEPLPYFFNKVGTSVFTYTNMKLLYQSLKAFATGGIKGGSGQGGKAMFSYIRDDLKDAAFRSGAIYTTEGKATVTFTAPENLTTWLVDAIGISRDTKLGTVSTGVIVSKELIIDPNLPLYLTLGDIITIPVKILLPNGETSGKVKGTAWLVNQQGDRVELGTFALEPNKTLAVPVAVPSHRWTSEWVDFEIQGTYGNTRDGISKRIPLRKDGFVSRDSVGMINKAGTHTFTLPESSGKVARIYLSQLPTNFIEPLAENLFMYPYGCTEQLLSSLLGMGAVQQLTNKKLFTSSLLSGNMVPTPNGPLPLGTAIRDGLNKILSYQQLNGGFEYWPSNGPDRGEKLTPENYILSAYVYNSLKFFQTRPEYASLLDKPLDRLESFLLVHRSLSDTGRYWYLLTKAMYGAELLPDEMSSLEQIKQNDTGYRPLIRYLIAVAQHDQVGMATWRPLARIPTNEDNRDTSSVFFNTVTAHALKLRALIDDPNATQQERSDLLLSLLKLRGKNGLWGYSTQNNLQVLLTLSRLSEFRKPQKSLTCTVDIDGKKQEVTVTTEPLLVTGTFASGEVTINWTCDGPLLADMAVDYIPENPLDLLGVEHHVTHMNRSLGSGEMSVGQTANLVGSFTTDVVGEQVAVELFVPSDWKLLNVISAQTPPDPSAPFVAPIQSTPFTVSDAHCQPTHRETRFDRLFLWYDILEPGVCDITIPALKAYTGKTTVMPMRVWEMYKGSINGRKVITTNN